jgi:murein DD-endopeptidase MepM/ murein hydrolase activator NlpD
LIRQARPVAGVALGSLLVVSAAAAPPAKPTATPAGKPPPATSPAKPTPPTTPRVHEVKRGDNLHTLARRYRVSVAALVAANRLPSERTRLLPGQRLVIPPVETAAGEAPRAARVTGGKRAGAASPRAATARAPSDFFFAVPDFADTLTAFIWPTEGAITSPFGRRRLGWHRGIDIKGERGDPIIAAAAGVVVVSGVEPRYGRVVKIEHEHGFTTVYAHNDDNVVDVGDWVVAGQRIGSIGRTGRATSYHLHFEIRREGRVYNPLYMLPLPARVAHVEETDEEEDHE